MRSIGTLAVVLASAIAAANCGGGSGGSTPTSPSTGNGGGTGGGSTSTTVTVSIKGQTGKQSFNPNPAAVNAGQLVVFKNDDNVTHHIVLDDGSMQTGDIRPGTSSAAMPIGAASKSYHCTIHPSMVGSFNDAPTTDPPCQGAYCYGGGD
jgi:plastocyanin